MPAVPTTNANEESSQLSCPKTERETVERKNKPAESERKKAQTNIDTSEHNKQTFDMQISLNIENET